MKKLTLAASAFGLGVVWFVLVTFFGKWQATWNLFGFQINVILGSILGAIAFTALLYAAIQFFASDEELPSWIYPTILIAYCLCMLGGIYFTEPKLEAGETRTVAQVSGTDYNYESTRTGHWFYYWYYPRMGVSTGSSSSTSTPHISTNKDTGKALAALCIVAVLVILVFGSFLFPHFWVLATLTIVFLLAALYFREMSLEESGYSFSSYNF